MGPDARPTRRVLLSLPPGSAEDNQGPGWRAAAHANGSADSSGNAGSANNGASVARKSAICFFFFFGTTPTSLWLAKTDRADNMTVALSLRVTTLAAARVAQDTDTRQLSEDPGGGLQATNPCE